MEKQTLNSKMWTTVGRSLTVLMLLILVFLVIYPMVWIALGGFKTNIELFIDSFALPSSFKPVNYVGVWNCGISKFFMNSIVFTAGSAVLVTACSALAAFPLSRFRFKSRRFWFLYLLCGLMLAPQVSLISNYKLLGYLSLYDTRLGLILVYTAFRIPFTMFLMWSYFMTIPKDIEESAYLDGCNSFMTFVQIVLPISKPIIATSILLTAQYVWNDFLFSLVYTKSAHLKTIPYGLNTLSGETGTDWVQLLAGMTISIIPVIVLFICLQKYFVRGLTVGSVKG